MNKITLDVIGSGDITSRPWQEQWDMVSDIARGIESGLVSDYSYIHGGLRVKVAKRSDVEKINARFGEGTIIPDENYAQFEDKEVCRVLADKFGEGEPITVDYAGTMTGFKSVFGSAATSSENEPDGPNIEYFDELPIFKKIVLCSYTSDRFVKCRKLKRINLAGVSISSASNGLFQHCTNLEEIDMSETIFVSNKANFGNQFLNCIKLKSFKLPYKEGKDLIDLVYVPNFTGCGSLEYIDLSGAKFANGINLSRTTVMTNDCFSLKKIIINEHFFDCALTDSTPSLNFEATFNGATNWTDAANITAMLDCLPDLTGFSDGRQGKLRLSANTFAQVSSAQIADAAAKGWNVYK